MKIVGDSVSNLEGTRKKKRVRTSFQKGKGGEEWGG